MRQLASTVAMGLTLALGCGGSTDESIGAAGNQGGAATSGASPVGGAPNGVASITGIGGAHITGSGGASVTGSGGAIHLELCGIALMGGCSNGVLTAQFGTMCAPLIVKCDNGCSAHPTTVQQYFGGDPQIATQYIQAALCEPPTPEADAGS
jgi:hypothetical protein